MEISDVHALLGRTAYGADGDRLGTVAGAYLDNGTGRPTWLTVERGGLFRTTRSFVPIDGAELVDDAVRLPVDADAVKGAPPIEDGRVLTQAEELQLRAHYGLAQPTTAQPTTPGPDVEATEAPESTTMTRSEERARVGTTTVPASRAVLRKTRVVEDRTFTVPLGRDQVQVAYEPLPDAGPAPVTAQPSQSLRTASLKVPGPGCKIGIG